MEVKNINPAKFVIPAKQNIKYLYNQLNDTAKKHQVCATFLVDRVEISTVTKTQKMGILKKLNEIKAKYTEE